jgi:histone H3/H4
LLTTARGRLQIMKADEDVKMIKPDALVLVVKATELFIGQFIKDAYSYTKQEKRKTVKFRDLEKVVRDIEVYDFLTTDENILRKGTEEPQGKRLRMEDGTEQPDPDDVMLGESDHDFWLPISNIKRVAKSKLNEVIPGDAKVNLEATACVAIARAATIFISLITATALDTCGKRSTLMSENIYQAIEEVEFEGFGEVLNAIEDQARNAPVLTDEQKPPKKKKALSGFFRFSMEKRADVKLQHPEASVSECAKILGKLWRELTDEQRLSYKDTSTLATDDGAGADGDAAVGGAETESSSEFGQPGGAVPGGMGDEMAAMVGAGGLQMDAGGGGGGGGPGGSMSMSVSGADGLGGQGLQMNDEIDGIDENARRLAEANQANQNDDVAENDGGGGGDGSGGVEGSGENGSATGVNDMASFSVGGGADSSGLLSEDPMAAMINQSASEPTAHEDDDAPGGDSMAMDDMGMGGGGGGDNAAAAAAAGDATAETAAAAESETAAAATTDSSSSLPSVDPLGSAAMDAADVDNILAENDEPTSTSTDPAPTAQDQAPAAAEGAETAAAPDAAVADAGAAAAATNADDAAAAAAVAPAPDTASSDPAVAP